MVAWSGILQGQGRWLIGDRMGLASHPLAGQAMIISLEKDDHSVTQINT